MNREEILGLPLGRRQVHTQAWGNVFVRQLRADELPALLEILDSPSGAIRLARFCVLGCIQADGSPLFLPGDEHRLTERALEPVSELAAAFLELNGIEGVTDPEAEKKSASGPSTSSPSVLPIDGGSRNRA